MSDIATFFDQLRKDFKSLPQHFLHRRIELHWETSTVSWIEKYFQETLVTPLYMCHSSGTWKTSKKKKKKDSLHPHLQTT